MATNATFEPATADPSPSTPDDLCTSTLCTIIFRSSWWAWAFFAILVIASWQAAQATATRVNRAQHTVSTRTCADPQHLTPYDRTA